MAKQKTQIKQHIWWHSRLVLVFASILLLSAITAQTISKAYAVSYEFEGTSVRLIDHDKTAPADGKSTIKFTVEFFGYKCTEPDYRGVYIIYPQPEFCNDDLGTDYGPVTGTVARTNAESPFSGNATVTGTINSNGFSGNLTGGTSLGHPHHQVIYPGSDGRITLSLTSTVAESKHVHVDNGNITDPNSIEFDVSFSAVPGLAPKAANPNAPPPSSAAGSQAKIIPLEAYTVVTDSTQLLKPASITLNSKIISQSDTKHHVDEDEGVVISGTAAPNALVTLYIFSDPVVVNVTADTNGVWSHTIRDLPAGDHHVETEISDPATKTKTKRINLASFRIVSSTSTATSKDNTSVATVSRVPTAVIGSSTVLLAVLVCFLLSRHNAFAHIFHRNHKKNKRK